MKGIVFEKLVKNNGIKYNVHSILHFPIIYTFQYVSIKDIKEDKFTALFPVYNYSADTNPHDIINTYNVCTVYKHGINNTYIFRYIL